MLPLVVPTVPGGSPPPTEGLHFPWGSLLPLEDPTAPKGSVLPWGGGAWLSRVPADPGCPHWSHMPFAS